MIHAQTAVNDSINTHISAHARLSRAIAEHTDAAALVEAAQNADNTDTRLHYLQQALEIDPFHGDAVALWNTLQADRYQRGLVARPAAHGTVHGAAAAFQRFGWTIAVELNRIAQLEKPICVRPVWAALVTLVFGLPGMLAVMWRITRARKARVHLQLEHDGALTVMWPRASRPVTSAAELVEIADSVPDGLTLPWVAFLGIVSTLIWLAILT